MSSRRPLDTGTRQRRQGNDHEHLNQHAKQRRAIIAGKNFTLGDNVEHFTIADVARDNPDFRKVLWTGEHTQIVVMTIPPLGARSVMRSIHTPTRS